MDAGEWIVDPYSGSMTTGRAAYKRGINSVSIDLHLEYCELGLRLLREEAYQHQPLKVERANASLFDLPEMQG